MAWTAGTYSSRFAKRKSINEGDVSIPFVAVSDSTGTIIESFGGGGGGTEYTGEATEAGNLEGGVVQWRNSSDVIKTAGTDDPLPVNVVAGGTSGGATEAKQDTQITEQSNQGTTLDSILSDLQGKADTGEAQVVDATGQGDVPVTLDGEVVVLGSGTAGIGKLTANSGVDIGDVDVTSTPATGLTTIPGDPVAATGLSSDSAWTTLITNTSDNQAKKLVIRNWCDKWIEVSYKDSPTDTSGTDIHEYITPWTVHEFNFKSEEGYIDTDVEVRRFDETPLVGYVQGTIYY